MLIIIFLEEYFLIKSDSFLVVEITQAFENNDENIVVKDK